MMMIPEPWDKHAQMSPRKAGVLRIPQPPDGAVGRPGLDWLYRWHRVGAVLDRNGLRPSRYIVTKDGRVIMASEVGVLEVDPANVLHKGRLEPGRMLLVDTKQGRIVEDEELKQPLPRNSRTANGLKPTG